jgi:hypothetical protein
VADDAGKFDEEVAAKYVLLLRPTRYNHAMLRIIAFIALAVFLVLYGLAAVTNIAVVHMTTVAGFAALVAGILIFILAVRRETGP